MTAEPQVRTSRDTKVTELFANENAWLAPPLATGAGIK